MLCGELASHWEDGEIVWLEVEVIDPSLEDSVELDLLVTVFAVRGLRISERGLVSVVS